ncbi:MAG: hypothetical protein RL701_3788 [Pseudomonadota bacterium]
MHAGLALRDWGPERLTVPFIQVAGTNGKGSVSSMLASALTAAGYRTGLFTSPHLHRFTERIRIDGQPLSTREATRRIADHLRWVHTKGAPEISFFELNTIMAVEAFHERKCDVAVLEVGLGGRLDATTALPAALSVITSISYDHTNVLGDSLQAIATEKAGIIRPGVPVIVGSRGAAVQRVIRARARELRAPLRLIERDFRALPERAGRVAFEVRGERIPSVKLGLLGEHQHDNAAIAVAALSALTDIGLPVPTAAIRRGLRDVRWPARLERVAGEPTLLFDAAHNPDGCRMLARYLAKEHKRPRVLIFGVMLDKDYATMLQLLAAHVEHVVYVQPDLPRARDPADLAALVPGEIARDAGDALRRAKRKAGSAGLVICAGSIFAVAELRAKALHLPSDPLIRM